MIQNFDKKTKKFYIFLFILVSLIVVGGALSVVGYETYSADYQRDLSLANQIEAVRLFTFFEDEVSLIEANVRRTPDRQLKITRIQAAEEWLPRQYAVERLDRGLIHGILLQRCPRRDAIGRHRFGAGVERP